MAKGNFKQIDLLRKRRKTNYLLEPYFVDTKKYIRKGIFSGLILIVISLILGIPFIFRIRLLENKIKKIKPFSDEYNLLVKKLDKETTQLQAISKFNNDLKNSIINISSSSALFQEIALIIPEDIQILEFITKGDSLFMKAKLSNDEYLETLNSFLLNLDKSDLIKFNTIDLKEINLLEDNSKETAYLVDLETRLTPEYRDINAKYLIKLGSYGLFNRLRLLKGIEEPLK
tara:strand:+ start:152 stop:841 length:690 start_codon:yes stop_codon:yes gene_type:complete